MVCPYCFPDPELTIDVRTSNAEFMCHNEVSLIICLLMFCPKHPLLNFSSDVSCAEILTKVGFRLFLGSKFNDILMTMFV